MRCALNIFCWQGTWGRWLFSILTQASAKVHVKQRKMLFQNVPISLKTFSIYLQRFINRRVLQITTDYDLLLHKNQPVINSS